MAFNLNSMFTVLHKKMCLKFGNIVFVFCCDKKLKSRQAKDNNYYIHNMAITTHRKLSGITEHQTNEN